MYALYSCCCCFSSLSFVSNGNVESPSQFLFRKNHATQLHAPIKCVSVCLPSTPHCQCARHNVLCAALEYTRFRSYKEQFALSEISILIGIVRFFRTFRTNASNIKFNACQWMKKETKPYIDSCARVARQRVLFNFDAVDKFVCCTMRAS